MTAGIHDRFVDGLTDRLKKLVVDDALKPGTEIGPVVDENQLDHDLSYLGVGKSEGARLHWGGERLNRENPGFYLQPALFTEATESEKREEIFGPVAAVIRVKDYEESLATANDTPFGTLRRHRHNKSQICEVTSSAILKLAWLWSIYRRPARFRLSRAVRRQQGLELWAAGQGRYAVEFYTTVKTAYVYPGSP